MEMDRGAAAGRRGCGVSTAITAGLYTRAVASVTSEETTDKEAKRVSKGQQKERASESHNVTMLCAT